VSPGLIESVMTKGEILSQIGLKELHTLSIKLNIAHPLPLNSKEVHLQLKETNVQCN